MTDPRDSIIRVLTDMVYVPRPSLASQRDRIAEVADAVLAEIRKDHVITPRGPMRVVAKSKEPTP